MEFTPLSFLSPVSSSQTEFALRARNPSLLFPLLPPLPPPLTSGLVPEADSGRRVRSEEKKIGFLFRQQQRRTIVLWIVAAFFLLLVLGGVFSNIMGFKKKAGEI